jgi:Cu(I)/Ag(I) efflux system protein CusF
MKCSTAIVLSFVMSTASLSYAQGNNMSDMSQKGKHSQVAEVHTTTAIVKKADPAKGKVTLTHGPIKSLNWPAMTMGFVVKEKKLFDQLAVGQKVEVELEKQGTDYVVVDYVVVTVK